MDFEKTSHTEESVTYRIIPDGSFLSSDWLCLDLYVRAETVKLRLNFVDKDGKPLVYMQQRMIPGVRALLPFPISEQSMKLGKCFLSPKSALGKGSVRGTPTEKKDVRSVTLTVISRGLAEAELYSAYCLDECPKVSLSGEKAVDIFGQGHGKLYKAVGSEQDLVSSLRAEYEKAKNNPSEYPEGYSRWGGWLGKRFSATGFFRIEKENGRYTLVDPDGYAFFSNGMCYGERAGIFGLTDGYRELFEWLPEEEGEFADAWCSGDNIPQFVVREGLENVKDKKLVNFTRVNLIRAFGDGWHKAYTAIVSSRLKRMGFNTIGVGTNDYYNERTDEFLAEAKIPYVVTFRDFPQTKERIFRDFPDVFSEEYKSLCEEFAQKSLAKYVGDKYFIGYFVTNEPEWFFAGDVNLTERLLAGDGCISSKRRFSDFAKEKYGDIGNLNSAWNTDLSDFDELLLPHTFEFTEEMKEDFCAFERLLVDEYENTVSDALRRVDPVHLNLGMRYAGVTERIMSFEHNAFDVFSFNCYRESPETAVAMCEGLDKPLLVGEWHIGAVESLLPAYGVRFVNTQKERAAACRYYAENGAAEPKMIGMHYFEYNDQPYFGRFDGECFQIGLADVCLRPYKEVCEMFEDLAKHIYRIHDGTEKPSAEHIDTQI